MMMSVQSRILHPIMRLFGRGVMPPACAEARAYSSEYIDGELTDAELEHRIRLHISGCPLCEAFFRTMRETIAVLHQVPAQTAPAGFTDRVRRNIRN
ncbi:MAG: hypothetical protein F4Y44_01565 [Chloroflexi bacterium]|nr:hypothetical protein [Chloroflexota bacterium]